MLVMYLPKEKIVAFADMYNVPPANNPVPNPPVISTVVLMDNLARLGLDFDTLVSTKNGCNLQPFCIRSFWSFHVVVDLLHIVKIIQHVHELLEHDCIIATE